MGNFSSVFKQLRIKEHFSQQELADKLGLSKSTISMYENGNREPDLETLEKIADFFNVDMDYLIGRNKTPNAFKSEPSIGFDDFEGMVARNGKKMSTEQKMRLIKLLSEI